MVSDAVSNIMSVLSCSEKEATMIVSKADAGGEISPTFTDMEWVQQRLLPNLVFLDESDYSKMCVDALKILSKTAATDFGSSRQRDLGQLWADMTRGYLGEMAFVKFLEKNGIKASLGHDVGELSDYLPMDIHSISKGKEAPRPPKIKIGIKATKWNGIWFDIPGDQFNHSDFHVLVKVGAGRDHLFSFFKSISVFKDKILPKGREIGSLNISESDAIYDAIPSLTPIPAYICGYVQKSESFSELSYQGKKGRKHYTITAWNGPNMPGDLEKIKIKEAVTGNVQFESIGEFSHENGYLFNAGNLKWKKDDWTAVLSSI